ncbi:MAG: ribosome maturation factor RimP [Streptosporangiales bacterium]|nr:ribosome maturation factor RimP [Streptosporangiales bacterium]
MSANDRRARLVQLLEPAVAAAGFDLEAVEVTPAGRRRLLRVVVDSDDGVDLDAVATVSHTVSGVLDDSGAMGDAPYVLEVSSPGVDRPLTEPRHWRRATGRLVRAPLPADDGATLEGRILAADDDGVTVDVDGEKRRMGYGELGPGRIQVEFRRDPDTPGDDGE